MKNKLVLWTIGSLSATLLISSFTFPQIQDKKKTRHIKLTKIENGNKMEIDTILSGDEVFVWKGDTIKPEKHIKKYSPAEFDRLHPTQKEKGPAKIRIIERHNGEEGDRMIMHSDSGKEFEIITDDGDTTGKKIYIHKMLRNGDERDHLILLDEEDGSDFPPIPPVPPVPHMKRFRAMHSGKSIDLNDPNIISYKKKKISGDREKIEIIRKRTNEVEEMDFDFNMEHTMDVPEPPMPPDIEDIQQGKADSDQLKQEIEVEKKINEEKIKENQPKQNK